MYFKYNSQKSYHFKKRRSRGLLINICIVLMSVVLFFLIIIKKTQLLSFFNSIKNFITKKTFNIKNPINQDHTNHEIIQNKDVFDIFPDASINNHSNELSFDIENPINQDNTNHEIIQRVLNWNNNSRYQEYQFEFFKLDDIENINELFSQDRTTILAGQQDDLYYEIYHTEVEGYDIVYKIINISKRFMIFISFDVQAQLFVAESLDRTKIQEIQNESPLMYTQLQNTFYQEILDFVDKIAIITNNYKPIILELIQDESPKDNN